MRNSLSLRHVLISGTVAVALPMPVTVDAQPSVDVMQAAQRSVARIMAEDCGNTPVRTATAFVWKDSQTLVTARHVVAGCKRIRVSLESTGKTYTVSPRRELAARDLVLLRSDQPLEVAPLNAAGGLPDVNSKVVVIGYPIGVPTSDSKMLDVTVRNVPPGSTLADLLPDGLRDQVEFSDTFALDTHILRLDGNLLLGHSGAPLLDAEGNVRAIGSGGLQNGAGGVVWAVRADYLAELAEGPEISAVAAEQDNSTIKFAYQQAGGGTHAVNCGPASFVFSRTSSLADLYLSSDDKTGLQQLATGANITLGASAVEKFDIWVDRLSGASLAVPAGKQIVAGDGGVCTVAVAPHVEMVVQVNDIPSPDPMLRQQQVQLASMSFETWLAGKASGPLATDPGSSYHAPMVRPDGFVVRRAGYFRNIAVSLDTMQPDYVFVTHMARGNRYYGVASMRRGLTVNTNNMQSCSVTPNGEACMSEKVKFQGWSRSALAIHLATIPPI